MPNPVALAPANDLAWAGTVSPSGPGEWLANGRTMNLRSDGFHWQVHSHLIRRTVAENGPCHAAANELAWAGTVSPSGPREWLANGGTMSLRSDGLHGQVHSHPIRRTVAENGPCQ